MNDSLPPSVEIASLKREVDALHMRIGSLLAAINSLQYPTANMLLMGDAAMDKAGRSNVTAGEVWLAMYAQATALADRLDRAVLEAFERDGEQSKLEGDLLSVGSIVRQLERQLSLTAMGDDLHVRISDPRHLIDSLKAAERQLEDERNRSRMLASALAETARERDALKLKAGHLENQKAHLDRWLQDSIVISDERFTSLIETEKAAGKNPDDEAQVWDRDLGWVPPLGSRRSPTP